MSVPHKKRRTFVIAGLLFAFFAGPLIFWLLYQFGYFRATTASSIANGQFIWTAAANMAADSQAASPDDLGWPADLDEAPKNSGDFVQKLINDGYLHFQDLSVLEGGSIRPDLRDGVVDMTTESGFNFYNVSEQDPLDTIFLTSRNVWLLDNKLSVVPGYEHQFKKPGFVVIRQDGSASFYSNFDSKQNGVGHYPEAKVKILPTTGLVRPK